MSSSKLKEASPPQKGPDKSIAIKDIIDRLDNLFKDLSEAKNKVSKGTIVPQVPEDGKNDRDKSRTNIDDESKKVGEMYMHNQLDKLIERNFEVLRSNITKEKIQIPLQHQVSSTIPEAHRYGQTTVASKEVENAEVKKRLLKFWWVGERLWPLSPRPAPEEKLSVKKTLGKFVKMGFIEPVTKKSRLEATSYKMHPIIRSLIIGLAKKANFFDYDSNGNPTMDISASKKSCLLKSEGTSWFSKYVPQPDPKTQSKGVKNLQKEKKQRQKEEDEQRIRLEKEKENKLKNLGVLQTLFNVSKQFPDLPVELFSKMTSIGVLYLGRWESTVERHMEVENTEFLEGLKS
ncbi:hypothetical protein CRYUN_Cryun07bG0192600 [Craigia yunnanensis]